MTTATEIEVVDLAVTTRRELNQRLHDARDGGPRSWRIVCERNRETCWAP